MPVASEKTEWASTLIVFLGILLNGKTLHLSLPLEKQEKALRLLNDISGKRKATIHELQVLTGYLNFLTKAIFAGRTFTRRMYAKCVSWEHNKGKLLKPHHHVSLDNEFKFDCQIWQVFLHNYRNQAVCRPMIDLDYQTYTTQQLCFYSDASANPRLGFGAMFNQFWLYAQWEFDFITRHSPSIEYLELFALVALVLTWGEHLRNMRFVLFCDNQAVVGMVNNLASSCPRCMYLLRILTLNNLVNNRRVFAKYVKSEANDLSDTLSRLQFERFWSLAHPAMNKHPSRISPLVWPVSKLWEN